ncbi:SctK family type III secretion system sorting platform protein [Bordetella genomosp. 9]|uniref:Type III secretion protein n=1 Tax=Bordetella genomosp. 9 TaxID=1416803 RepID=A0A1W6YX82_9BORD|nr:SctK family type III secretion system sorting platform protein [Bordetella genomosp. 9]ARP85656.1 hypothetical protein CAL13_05105 [Bordetella genomosp. 9]
MLAFNFCPSRTLHPSRRKDYASEAFLHAIDTMPAESAIWHRHWSRQILRQEKLDSAPVTDLSLPALRIALLDPESLLELARALGAVLCAPRLRLAIAGAQVRVLATALGATALRWLAHGRRWHPGLAGDPYTDVAAAADDVDQLGCGVLMSAFGTAGRPLARRAELKLPAHAPARRELPGDEAMDLVLRMSMEWNHVVPA